VDLAYACVMFFSDTALPSGIDHHGVRQFLTDYRQALSVEMPWHSWSENPSHRKEFEARCLLSAYLILLWAVNGKFDHLQSEDFEYGAELALQLISSSSLVENLAY
jgi:hypothetical protein